MKIPYLSLSKSSAIGEPSFFILLRHLPLFVPPCQILSEVHRCVQSSANWQHIHRYVIGKAYTHVGSFGDSWPFFFDEGLNNLLKKALKSFQMIHMPAYVIFWLEKCSSWISRWKLNNWISLWNWASGSTLLDKYHSDRNIVRYGSQFFFSPNFTPSFTSCINLLLGE